MRTVLLRPSKYLRRHLSTDVVKLSYNVYGEQDDEARSKPPVVFVHGMLGHKSNLSSVCKAIHQRLHRMVVAPDLRNHGHSPHVATKMTIQNMADDVLAMLDDFSCRRVGGGVSLIGHSLGGKIVGLLALKNPSVVGSVVIEDVALRRMNVTSHIAWKCLEVMKKVSAMAAGRQPQDGVIDRQFVIQGLYQLLQDKSVADFLATNAVVEPDATVRWLPNIDAIEQNMKALFDFPNIGRSEVYPGPTLLIRGANSTYVLDDDLPSMRLHFPALTLSTVPDAGHWVHADQPNEFVQRICEFLVSASQHCQSSAP